VRLGAQIAKYQQQLNPMVQLATKRLSLSTLDKLDNQTMTSWTVLVGGLQLVSIPPYDIKLSAKLLWSSLIVLIVFLNSDPLFFFAHSPKCAPGVSRP
jgi:hypothetical protein